MVFRFTGVSLPAARALTVAIFGLILLCCYRLLGRWAAGQDGLSHASANPHRPRSLAPAVAVLLLAANPFYFAFSRLAILEPLMILLALAALMLAHRTGAAALQAGGASPDTLPNLRRRVAVRALAWSALLGIALIAMVLTKTTGLFLLPAIAWMLWAGCGYRLRVALSAGAVASVVAGTLWGAYMLLWVRPRYIADYRYLFSANAYTGISRATFWPVLVDTFFAGEYLGVAFFFLGIAAAILLASLAARRLRRDALTLSLLLWILSYGAFLAYHDNLQPRYYQVIGVPLAMLIAMALDRLARLAANAGTHTLRRQALAALAAAGALAALFTVVRGATQEAAFVRHPQYTFLTAVNHIRDAIERRRAEDRRAGRPVQPQLVLSISGAQMQLMTGLPAICDDFGAMTLPDRIAAYPPGWFVTWNDVEDDKMEALAPVYRLLRVGAWPAFDDPERNLLILYRLDRLQAPGRGQGRRRRTVKVPRRLQTRQGEQPTIRQLEH